MEIATTVDYLIKQPYHLTVSRNSFNIHEQRILIRILECLQQEMVYKQSPVAIGTNVASERVLRLKTKDFMRKGSKNYVAIRQALNAMLKKEVRIQGIDKKDGRYELVSNLISEYKYFYNNEFVEITIPKSVFPYLISLSSYTKYSFTIAFDASSPYTCRIYQYFSHWRDKKSGFEMTVHIDQLRAMLDLGKKYERANGIRRFILTPAIKELKEKEDVWFSIKEPIKEGRKIVGWVFKIHHRDAHKKPEKALPPPPKNPKNKEKGKIIEDLTNTFKLTHWQAVKVYNHVPHEALHKALYPIRWQIANKEINKNIGGYTWSTLCRSFGLKAT